MKTGERIHSLGIGGRHVAILFNFPVSQQCSKHAMSISDTWLVESQWRCSVGAYD